jgi:Bacterial Ig-like domain (group 2)
MRNTPKVPVLASLTTIALLVLAAGCTGFFVNPTLTSIDVRPTTPTVKEGNTRQMSATGTYDDGSTKDITGSVDWTTSDDTVATVTSGGLVKGISAGSADITAAKATVEGSTTVTPASISRSGAGQTVDYTATGHFSSGPDQDITEQVTWSVSPTAAANISNSSGTRGQLTTMAVTTATDVTVTATSGNIQGSATLTLNP